MSATNLADVKSRAPQVIYGCGTQFTQTATEYPQSKDLDRHLSSGHQQQDQPKVLPAVPSANKKNLRGSRGKEDRQYGHAIRGVGKQSSSGGGGSGSGGKPWPAQSDPMLRWEQTPQGELPWDHVRALHGERDESKSKAAKGKTASSLDTADGNI